MDDKELGRLLGETTESPGPSAEALHAIVNRSRRGTRTALSVAVVVGLIAVGLVASGVSDRGGPSTAVLAGDQGGSPQEQVAQAQPAQQAQQPQPAPAPESGQVATAGQFQDPGQVQDQGQDQLAADTTRPQEEPLERLFLRSSGGVAIRAYLHQPRPRPECPPDRSCPAPPPPECLPTAVLGTELSNEGAVRAAAVPVRADATAAGMVVLRAGVFGLAEGSPAQWVAVHAGSDVKRVRARFVDGSTDEMETVQGYAVLAHGVTLPASGAQDPAQRPRSGPGGTVEGLDDSGKVVASEQLSPRSPPPLPPGCVRPGGAGFRGPGPEDEGAGGPGRPGRPGGPRGPGRGGPPPAPGQGGGGTPGQ